MNPDHSSIPSELDLFEGVVQRCGLASWVGPGLLRRALQAVGVEQAGEARSEHFRRALPQLEARMAVYLKPPELSYRLAAIRLFLETR